MQCSCEAKRCFYDCSVRQNYVPLKVSTHKIASVNVIGDERRIACSCAHSEGAAPTHCHLTPQKIAWKVFYQEHFSST